MALRDPTPEEVSQLIDEGFILNEPGADLLTRWMAKTFSSNPQQAKAFLERQGFQVMETSDKGKLQFAIRNKKFDAILGAKNNPTKVLDPDGFDMGDLADIAFDIFVGGPVIGAAMAGGAGATTLAGVGPIPGGIIGGGGGAALVEDTRQVIGKFLGVNVELDPGKIMEAAAAGAILPPVIQRLARFPQTLLRAGKFAATKAGLIARNLAARVAGVSEEQITAAAASAARTSTVLGEKAAKPIELLDKIRGTIDTLRNKTNLFPETREMNTILERARPVPLKGLFNILSQERVQPIGTEKVGVTSSRRIAEQVAHKLGFRSSSEAAVGHVSAKQAEEIKQILQGQIDFSGRPGEKFLNGVLKQAQGNLRNRIESSIPTSQARARYRDLNGFASFTESSGKFRFGRGVVGKMEALNELERRVGEHQKGGTAERFLQAVTGEGRTQERRLVEQFDRVFGTGFIEEGLTTRLAKPFSRDAPKLTAFGQFIGPGVGAGIGAKIAGPPGAVVGAVVGFQAGSPKGMLRIGRGVTRAEEISTEAIRKGGRLLRRVETLQDYLSTRGAGALAAMVPGGLARMEPEPVITSEEELRQRQGP